MTYAEKVCLKKVRYMTRKHAREKATRVFRNLGNKQKPYKCRCGGYHLTSCHE